MSLIKASRTFNQSIIPLTIQSTVQCNSTKWLSWKRHCIANKIHLLDVDAWVNANSSRNDSPRSTTIYWSQMDLPWNILHCRWSYLYSVASWVAEIFLQALAWLTCKYAANRDYWVYSTVNHFHANKSNTYRVRKIMNITRPRSVDSTILVHRIWKKFWSVHMRTVWRESSPKL